MVEHDLPVQVGQLAESKSFIHGFRGAWFRCKVHKITRRNGDPYVHSKYYDFPDEKILSTKLYQTIPSVKPKKQQLMVRPRFPPVYRKSEKINIDNISEVTIIAEDEWKEGDLVDWWKDNCYWSGRVTKILDNEKVQIELPPPPEGEGDTWDAYSKDLRPSLEWSPETGWTLPTIKVGEHNRHFAQLIKPVNEGKPVHLRAAHEVQKNTKLAAEGPWSTTNSRGTLEPSGSGVQKTRSSDTVSGFDIQEGKEKEAAAALEELKSESTIRLNSMFSNTIEDAVLDLETLATCVRMFQDILDSGVLPETGQFSLKIPKRRAPSMPK
ncbi:uncharacterized protein LOC116208458 [Punica granatum]|nr:uncharacterized protein LOC116208458 [Punica granatum]XP_031397783.1 uncharacterized protein LOC116208458 [Punica granatum]XP_031397784.1 uncharacterized protein LOC116208458 [Punica granatum]XP_031397785.1 uncharacterized protein LOC116208458 [Punica granatum]XP_031397786.1 uncharacterized protein LOC116208458 [Punica granatum]